MTRRNRTQRIKVIRRAYSEKSNTEQSIWKKILTPFFTGIVTLSIGSFLGSYLTQINWEKQYATDIKYQERNVVIQKRVEMIDTISKLISDNRFLKLDHEKLLSQLELNIERVSANLEVEDLDSRIKETYERLYSFRRNLFSAMQLSTMYFGPKTNETVMSFNNKSELWLTEQEEQNLLDALLSEINYFPNE
ncbi:hypothetical protein QP794_09955 [Paenibacillus sp. UMB7766-LJ446]|uniref:hypothetical protein n=1 Tax=Paenibacillus sp. UMB7766-LJ446 TaxID=3046313 RepID=UPI00254D80EB|nr:hypothetical protein [Paenibacillus sp. UMB7766-LJ446]MDK8190409.1 hypothetical protein [Paenibacillus sp. UMB7766-LJ446]